MASGAAAEWLEASPVPILGHLIARVRVRGPAGWQYLTNAQRIWQLSPELSATDPAAYARARCYAQEYVFAGFSRVGRLVVAPAPEPGLELYLSPDLLRAELLRPDGTPVSLRPTAAALEAALQGLSQQQTADLAASEQRWELKQLSQSLEAAQLAEPTKKPKSGSERPWLWLAVLAVSLLLIMLAVVIVLVWMWFEMAQQGVEEPGQNYLEVLSRKIGYIVRSVLLPPREATDEMMHLAGEDKQVPFLDEPYTVSGYDRFWNPVAEITTSKIWEQKSYALALAQYLAANLDSHLTVPYLGIGFGDGSLVSASNSGCKKSHICVRIRDMNDLFGIGNCVMGYEVDADDYSILLDSVSEVSCSYDPRNRTWYQDGLSVGDKSWGGGVYPSYGTGNLLVTSTEPLFSHSQQNEAILGISMADCQLLDISDYLAEHAAGKTGVTYVYERDQELIAASQGKLSKRDANGTPVQLKVSESDNPTIRESVKYLESQVGEDIWASAPISTVGNALSNTPMQLTVKYSDDTSLSTSSSEGINWLMTATIPAVDYYGFITYENSYVSLTFFTVTVILTSILMLSTLWDSNPVQAGTRLLHTRAPTALAVTVCVCVFLYVWWLSTAKDGVDVMAVKAMAEVAEYIQTYVSYRYETLVKANNYTTNICKTGSLVLDSGTVVSNTSLDSYFLTQLRLVQKYGSVNALYIGFEDDGNFLGATTEAGWGQMMVRDSRSIADGGTDGAIVYYNTTGSAESEMRNTSAWTAWFDGYDARNRPWYIDGKAQNRSVGDNSGQGSLASAFLWDGFYTDCTVTSMYANSPDSTLIGVLGIESDFNYMNELLANTTQIYPQGADLLVLQDRGEVVGRTSKHNIMTTSTGGITLVNGKRVTELMKLHGSSLIASQGITDMQGEVALTYTSAAGLYMDSDYISEGIIDTLNKYTILEVIPRKTYFDTYETYANTTFSTLLVAATMLFIVLGMVAKLRSYIVGNASYHNTSLALGSDEECNEIPVQDSGDEGKENSVTMMTMNVLANVARCISDDVIDPEPVPQMGNDVGAIKSKTAKGQGKSFSNSPEGLTSMHPSGQPWFRGIKEKNKSTASESESEAIEPHSVRIDAKLDVSPTCSSLSSHGTGTSMSHAHHVHIASDSSTGHPEGDSGSCAKLRSWAKCLDRWIFCGGWYFRDRAADPLECEGAELEQLTRVRLAPLVKRLRQQSPDPDSLRQKLNTLAVDYLLQIQSGYLVYDAAAMEARLEPGDWRIRVCRVWAYHWIQLMLKGIMVLFVLTELCPKDSRFALDVSCGVLLTVDGVVRYLRQLSANGWVRGSSLAQVLAAVIFWTLLICIPDVSGLAKPFVILSSIPELKAAMSVFIWAIAESMAVFMLFFVTLFLSAIMMLLLFHGKYTRSAAVGSNATDFLNTFVAMFARLTSADNLTQIVDPMYARDSISFLFFAFFSIAGIFLSSMVLAVFQMRFETSQSDIAVVTWQRQNASLCCSFVLLTWELDMRRHAESDGQQMTMAMPDFVQMMLEVWKSTNKQPDSPRLEAAEPVQPPGGSQKQSEEQLSALCESLKKGRAQSHRIPYQKLLARTIFAALDDDDSGTVDCDEFNAIFRMTECVQKVKADELLGWRAICAKWEVESAALEPETTALAETSKIMLQKAHHGLQDYMKSTLSRRKIGGMLRWRDLDAVLILVIMAHGYILSIYTSENILADSTIFTLSAVLCLILYPFDIALRMYSLGGFRSFVRDTLFPYSQWSNMTQIALTTCGFVCAVLYFALEGRNDQVLQAFMSIVLWRIFFVTPVFCSMLYNLYHGLRGVSVYIQLLWLVFYTFSFAAWRIFDGKIVPDHNKFALRFESFEDSMFIMFTMFIGGGWVDTMQMSVDATNTSMVWFFVLYVVVMAMLFLNLFVGIIITVFQEAETTGESHCGKLALILHWQVLGFDHEKRHRFFKQLGYLASLLYAPALRNVKGLLVLSHKCRDEVEDYDADLVIWAAAKLQAAYRRRKRSRALNAPPQSVLMT